MSISMVALLAHSEQLPPAARDALRDAHLGSSSPQRRLQLLESAARILHRESGLTCEDARELLDL